MPSFSLILWLQGKGGSKGVAQLHSLLRMREANMLGHNGGFNAPERCHLGAHMFRPNFPVELIDRMQSRAYIGQFSAEGDVFIGACCILHISSIWYLEGMEGCRSIKGGSH